MRPSFHKNDSNVVCSTPPTRCSDWAWDSDWDMSPNVEIPPPFDKYEKTGKFYSNNTEIGTFTMNVSPI